ncbi:MAG: hypothetical protein IIW89_02620, partial [Alistipes sp.]|nr:hypothetical protein [Alistipes sp.]
DKDSASRVQCQIYLEEKGVEVDGELAHRATSIAFYFRTKFGHCRGAAYLNRAAHAGRLCKAKVKIGNLIPHPATAQ